MNSIKRITKSQLTNSDLSTIAGITIVQMLDAHMDAETRNRARMLAVPQAWRITDNGLRVGQSVVFDPAFVLSTCDKSHVFRIEQILYAFQSQSGAPEVMLTNLTTGNRLSNGVSPTHLMPHTKVRVHG